ncbi:MAG: SGNH/GDSL hydrolase family protein [Nostocaceae cyanobacterium]|nr:SGNH/GDSL hydrolase family protein [Nostocaceae cyanobacterium]
MKKQLVATGFILFSLSLPIKASAAIDQLYVFGDSLSDTGNTYKATQGIIPPSPPYFQGRFSNGPVWVEDLATSLGIKQTNFAFGGATTGTENVGFFGQFVNVLPGLDQQVKTFTTANPTADPNGLYVVWAGANDYLGGGVLNPQQPVSNLQKAVTSLASVGAKNFLVANLPDLGELPGTRNNPNAGGLNTLTTFHNSGLSATLSGLSKQTGLNIIPLDVNSLFGQALATPQKFGFTNVTDPCLNSQTSASCAKEDEYLFWDQLHPTKRTHSIIAQAAFAAVPESTSTFGLLAFGIGVATVVKRQQKARV